MRALSPLNKNKNGLSNIVAYVLLISITISLSVLVYGWLRFYVSEDVVETCSDNVNVVIRSYECFRNNYKFLDNIHHSSYRPEGAYSLELFATFIFYELGL